MARIVSLEEGIAELVSDGDTVALEGFTHLIPFAAGHELLRQSLMTLREMGCTSASLTGLLVAWGYRFHLAGQFGGRFEVNYLQSGKNTDLGIGPTNTLGLAFGAMMPLK